jgi:outer membrane immunogenic protein
MSTSAYAADVYSKSSMKDEPVYDAPAAIWAGLYVGGSAGFGVGNTTGHLKFDQIEALREVDGPDFNPFSSDYDVNGAIYGVHIGYNFQRDNWVYGVEVGFNGSGIEGSDNCFFFTKCERSLDWYATGVGRLGYASGKTLFYGFGGVAWGSVQTDISTPHFTLSGDATHVGWTAGLGIEHAITDRLSARVEYSHVDLGKEDHDLGHGLKSEVDLSFDAIKVGASYKLTGSDHGLEPLK